LVELPTKTEIEDNIVAFWRPERRADAGGVLDYRLYWVADEPFPPSLARVVDTRLGRPGRPGPLQAKQPQGRKFVVEFAGGPLTDMAQRFDLAAVTTVSRGTVANAHVLKILGTDRWRAEFDLTFAGQEPVDMRCFLRLGATALSETWLYQYLPGHYGLPSE
jgi:glucans biosynthesis protein